MADTTYASLSEFSAKGINIGDDSKVMAYLHGLSDFWVYMFDDASKINTLMEANAVVASDIYNKFLQLTSGISLEDISVLTNAQIKLILISDEDNAGVSSPTIGKVNGKVETYYLPPESNLKYAKYFVNRAMLPTSTLEAGADFHIDPDSGQVSFAKSLANCGFPFRILSSGARQYAMWAIDAKMDDQLIYKHYAKLLGINPTTSTELFKDFVYGMYYLYINGPDVLTLRKGLNLALGIPLARDKERVLEIRKFLTTDQFMVITDVNSYVIPYGLEPTVVVDDELESGDELATWVEVKDYETNGEWWINFMIPASVMPHVPVSVPGGSGVLAETVPNRYATAGSYADWLMRNYLRKHTFLVNIKTVSFKNIQAFEQLSDIINDVKPSWTTPIYVWTLPVQDDILALVDNLDVQLQKPYFENLIEGIYRFTRDSSDPLPRNMPLFTRVSVPATADCLVGRDVDMNGQRRDFNGGFVSGFIAPQRSYSTLSDGRTGWLKALRSRGQEQCITRRGKIDFKRNYASIQPGTSYINPFRDKFPDVRFVYLYTTTRIDLEEKLSTINMEIPSDYIFSIFQPTLNSDQINEHAINDFEETDYSDFLASNFDYFFTKGSHGATLSPFFPQDSYKTFKPTVTELTAKDYVVFTNIGDNCFGAFWATQNFFLETTPYYSHAVSDPLTMTISGPVTRGMAPHGSPYYMLRSGGTIGYNTSRAINDEIIDGAIDPVTTVSRTYQDSLNTTFTIDRSGKTLVTRKTWK
jgi:hypothetical protein